MCREECLLFKTLETGGSVPLLGQELSPSGVAPGGGAATKLCHGHPGHAGARAGRPWHFLCAMAILAMPGHGQDARGTSSVPWPSWPCRGTGRMPVALPLCHGHPGHAGARAGRPWHSIAASALIAHPKSSSRKQAFTLLQLQSHSAPSRMTLRYFPIARK